MSVVRSLFSYSSACRICSLGVALFILILPLAFRYTYNNGMCNISYDASCDYWLKNFSGNFAIKNVLRGKFVPFSFLSKIRKQGCLSPIAILRSCDQMHSGAVLAENGFVAWNFSDQMENNANLPIIVSDYTSEISHFIFETRKQCKEKFADIKTIDFSATKHRVIVQFFNDKKISLAIDKNFPQKLCDAIFESAAIR